MNLDEFKNEESPEQIMCLRDNPALQRVVAAWPYVRRKAAPKPRPSTDDPWEAEWRAIDVDLAELRTKAAVYEQDVEALFETARGMRLIYPDGTVNQYARQYIRALIIKELPRQPSKKT
jgi:hypothetical protein